MPDISQYTWRELVAELPTWTEEDIVTAIEAEESHDEPRHSVVQRLRARLAQIRSRSAYE